MLTTKIKGKDINIGETVKVKYNIVEGTRSRVQTFEGIIISFQGRGASENEAFSNTTFTVRRIGDRGVGVERIWPVDAKTLVDIEVVKLPKKVRRSKLYYLRNLTGRMATRV